MIAHSAKEAFALGVTVFMPKTPCVRCGTSLRTKWGNCISCDKAVSRRRVAQGTPVTGAKGGRYFLIETPCRKCGSRERWPSGACVPCDLATTRKWSQETGNLKSREDGRRFRAANPDYMREWQRRNAAYCAAYTQQRNAAKIQASPPWLTDEHGAEILAFYEEAQRRKDQTGIPHEVDHVVPLRGPWIVLDGKKVREVCGLDVPWNLQVLTEDDNGTKKNFFDPDGAAREQMAWLRERNLTHGSFAR